MLELTTTFTPADGSSPRTITLRISDVRPDPEGFTWSIAVDVLGFEYDDSVRLKQVDWAAAIEDAGRFIKRMVADKVELAGGGTLDPPILPPET
ncbi:hypothetical protein WME76_33435 [Sorangium sp. So ce119]|uniref:hypothetical protein n=1 Tax=Sorangium sp. So ce119 TaxID=3133279 RepID=UPI003F63DC39